MSLTPSCTFFGHHLIRTMSSSIIQAYHPGHVTISDGKIINPAYSFQLIFRHTNWRI